MNIKTSYHRGLFDSNSCHVIKSRDELKLGRIEYIDDYQRNQLVILLECDHHLTPEIKAFVQGDNLIIEALRSVDYRKPFRTHLIKRETLSDYEKGRVEVGFSEVQLNSRFRYSLLSCQMIRGGLLKVILSFHRIEKQNLKYN